MAKSNYDLDEFDKIAETLPAGVHRRPVKRWRKILPFVLVIIIGPLTGWGAFVVFKHSGNSLAELPNVAAGQNADSSAVTTPESDTPTADATPSEIESTEPTETHAEPTEQIDRNVAVKVLNSAAPQGAAKRAADAVVSLGYTSAKADNGNAQGLNGSTVIYSSPDYRLAAEEIAAKLGISNVIERTGNIQSADGVVVYLLEEAKIQ